MLVHSNPLSTWELGTQRLYGALMDPMGNDHDKLSVKILSYLHETTTSSRSEF